MEKELIEKAIERLVDLGVYVCSIIKDEDEKLYVKALDIGTGTKVNLQKVKEPKNIKEEIARPVFKEEMCTLVTLSKYTGDDIEELLSEARKNYQNPVGRINYYKINEKKLIELSN